MDREDISRQFGPKLIEGLIETLQDEINEIRAFIGMPSKDKASLLARVKDKEKNVLDYEWLKDVQGRQK